MATLVVRITITIRWQQNLNAIKTANIIQILVIRNN